MERRGSGGCSHARQVEEEEEAAVSEQDLALHHSGTSTKWRWSCMEGFGQVDGSVAAGGCSPEEAGGPSQALWSSSCRCIVPGAVGAFLQVDRPSVSLSTPCEWKCKVDNVAMTESERVDS